MLNSNPFCLLLFVSWGFLLSADLSYHAREHTACVMLQNLANMKPWASEGLNQCAGHTSAFFTDTTVRTGRDREQNMTEKEKETDQLLGAKIAEKWCWSDWKTECGIFGVKACVKQSFIAFITKFVKQVSLQQCQRSHSSGPKLEQVGSNSCACHGFPVWVRAKLALAGFTSVTGAGVCSHMRQSSVSGKSGQHWRVWPSTLAALQPPEVLNEDPVLLEEVSVSIHHCVGHGMEPSVFVWHLQKEGKSGCLLFHLISALRTEFIY